MMRTVFPALRTDTEAMPAPMSPPPRIPIFETSFGSAWPEMPVACLIICEARKLLRRALDSGDVTNSPKNTASAS